MAIPTLRRGGSIIPLRRTDNTAGINRLEPWNDFATLDRVFDNFFRSPLVVMDRNSNGHQSGESQVELYETNDELVAYLFAPGLDTDSLDISATSQQISIRGERKPKFTATEGTTCHTPWASSATSSSTFSAAYALPTEINPDQVNASYKDGVLEVKMAKHEATKPKQVKVQVSQ